MLPPVEESVLQSNPKFAELYKKLSNNILNPNGSTKNHPAQKERDAVSAALKTARIETAKSQILITTLSSIDLSPPPPIPAKPRTRTSQPAPPRKAAELPEALVELIILSQPSSLSTGVRLPSRCRPPGIFTDIPFPRHAPPPTLQHHQHQSPQHRPLPFAHPKPDNQLVLPPPPNPHPPPHRHSPAILPRNRLARPRPRPHRRREDHLRRANNRGIAQLYAGIAWGQGEVEGEGEIKGEGSVGIWCREGRWREGESDEGDCEGVWGVVWRDRGSEEGCREIEGELNGRLKRTCNDGGPFLRGKVLFSFNKIGWIYLILLCLALKQIKKIMSTTPFYAEFVPFQFSI
ncbi:hypothetical protein EYC84_005916 [Monilinia fructicola]|uniref:Uncharacterized protein n=1 Tax=Monilinia fructicola TaxID=38448 RepID=A0A5M9K110_MONFR|nr:hypothetical protein EYC84_005916 [Monilinia fructicola]